MNRDGPRISVYLTILGVTVLSVGAYLPWAVLLVGTAVEHTTLQSAGIYPGRFLLLVPGLLALGLHVNRTLGRAEVFLLAVGSMACAVVPPLRWMSMVNQEAMTFTIGSGLIVSVVSGLLFAAAASARYFEIQNRS